MTNAKLAFIKPGEPNGLELAEAHAADTAQLLSPERESELRERPEDAPADLVAIQQRQAELKRTGDRDRQLRSLIPGYKGVAVERLDCILRDRQRLVRSLIRGRHPTGGCVRAARVSRCGSRRRERRSRTTRRRSGARDGPSDQGEADGDEPSAVPTHRPLVAVAQLRHGGHAAIACHARRGSRLADLDERWTLEAAARERRATGAEQLASLWRRSEAEQAEFFRTALEQVEAREASLRAEVVA
jgi:hypothetical protein